MPAVRGNPDFEDRNETDLEIVEIVEEFYDGTVSFSELKAIVGAEVAQAIMDHWASDDYNSEKLFDNPEDF